MRDMTKANIGAVRQRKIGLLMKSIMIMTFEDPIGVHWRRKTMNKVIGHYKAVCPFCKRVTKIKEIEDGLSIQSCCEHYSHLEAKIRPIKVYFKGTHLVDTEEGSNE